MDVGSRRRDKDRSSTVWVAGWMVEQIPEMGQTGEEQFKWVAILRCLLDI